MGTGGVPAIQTGCKCVTGFTTVAATVACVDHDAAKLPTWAPSLGSPIVITVRWSLVQAVRWYKQSIRGVRLYFDV